MSVQPPGGLSQVPSYGQPAQPNVPQLANILATALQDFRSKIQGVLQNPSLADNPNELQACANVIKDLNSPSKQAASLGG